jgi:hypothetical protein
MHDPPGLGIESPNADTPAPETASAERETPSQKTVSAA